MAKFTSTSKNLTIINGDIKIVFIGGVYETTAKNKIETIKKFAERIPEVSIVEIKETK